MEKTWVKTPTVFQMEATECGAASLLMILKYYGKSLPLEEVRIDCGVSRDGCNAKNILRGARKHGLKAKGFRKGLDALRDSSGPSIIHWNFNHFVVYEGYKKGHMYINDPAMGRRKMTYEEMNENFTGIVLEFEKDVSFETSKEKETLFYYLNKRLGTEKVSVLYMLLIGLCLVLPGLIIPVFSKVFIDDILLGGNSDWFKGLVWAMISMAVLQSALSYMQRHFLLRFQTKLSLLSTDKFLRKLFRLPVNFFEQRYAGDISGRVASNDTVASFLAGELAQTLLNLITASFYLVLLLVYSAKLTFIGVLLAGANLAFLKITAESISNKKMKMEQDQGRLDGVLFTGIRIVDSLKASGAENQYLERLLGYYAKVIRNEQELGEFRQYMASIPQLTLQLTDIIILIVGGLDVISGRMTVGMLLAFGSLMRNFLSPVNELIGFGERIQDLKVNMSRINDIENYQYDARFLGARNAQKLEKTRLDGAIEVRDMDFGYSALDPPLLEKFHFKVQPGKSIAFVGPSGSGKSTVSKIVSGLYQPWSGAVHFDGIDRVNIPAEVLNTSIAVVSQEISMFAGTVKDNITLWDNSISESDMIRAAKDACIHDAIATKSGGYEHVVQEGGGNFSGGQRQRLEIARALALNPTVMVLDEATSALDPQTEKDIMDNIKRRGCTLIVVAHRLSAIRDCDEIIVMTSGKVVQRGRHDELKGVDGHYKALIQHI